MSIVPAGTTPRSLQVLGDAASHDYVSIFIAGQMFGIPVLQVQDVLGPQRITRIPLAPPEVAGSLNLRGRIVTAIDVRTRLKLPKNTDGKEVLSLTSGTYERNPATLDPAWRDVSNGIHRLDGNLLIILDVARLLDFATSADAA